MVEDKSLRWQTIFDHQLRAADDHRLVIVSPFLARSGRLLYDERGDGSQEIRHHSDEVWSLEAYRVYFLDEYDFPRHGGFYLRYAHRNGVQHAASHRLMAYGLARKDLDGRQCSNVSGCVYDAVSGRLIPTFLVVKELGMIDTYASLDHPDLRSVRLI